MYTGFYIEKGFGRAVATVPGIPKGSIMDSEWHWDGFIDRLSRNQYEEPMRRVLELYKGELWILLEAWSFNKPPALDTERAGPDDRLLFVISDASLHMDLRVRGYQELRHLNGVAAPSELAQGISENKALDYFWVDLHIGTLMRYGDESTGNWGAHEVWTRTLEPWESLVIEVADK